MVLTCTKELPSDTDMYIVVIRVVQYIVTAKTIMTLAETAAIRLSFVSLLLSSEIF
jgi:hypothetical protein